MLNKNLFQFEFHLQCPSVLREAAEVVESLFQHRDVCLGFCDPIVNQLPACHDASSFKGDDLFQTAQNFLSSCIKVEFNTEQKTLVKLDLSKTILHLNPRYCAYDESSQEQHDRCLLLIIIKLIHSVIRFLTASFYVLRGHTELLERDKDGHRKYHVPAPCTLGSCYGKGRMIVGNLGFAFEDHALGGRLVVPVSGTNISYANPLIILANTGTISKRKFFYVEDKRVRTVLQWVRTPRRATIQHLLLHDVSDFGTEIHQPKKRGLKRSNPSPTKKELPFKKKPTKCSDAVSSEEQCGLEAWKDSVLRFSDVESEGEDVCGDEEEIDPVVKRLISSDHFVDKSGHEEKAV